MAPITRRRFNRDVALALAAAGCASTEPDEPLRPTNLLVITADDLGRRDLSSYGLSGITTPGIDRIVNEGVAFDRAFDAVSTCSSSRATFVTGQFPHTHGVTGLVHRNPELSLAVDHPTSVRRLAEAGFACGLQGKWHLSDLEGPEAFGYDEWLATDLDQVIKDPYVATGFLQSTPGPWYLELNFMQPHRDVFGEFPQADGYPVALEDAAPPEYWGLPDWPEIRAEVAGYLSRLRWMDDIVAAVLAELDRQGIGDDTLVAFISDNGPAFPGNKLTLYDRGTGTPLAFRWPGGLTPTRHDTLVSSVDLAPTLLDLLGLPPLAGAQGRSLAPLLRGDAFTPADAVFSEMESHGSPVPARAIRTDRYKYIRNLSDRPWGMGGASSQSYADALAELPEHPWLEPRVPEELYDLDTDPLERINLVDDPEHGEILRDLSERLDAHMLATDDFRAPDR